MPIADALVAFDSVVVERPADRVLERAARDGHRHEAMPAGHLPEMNGYHAIAHLRRVPALSAMPAMVLTSEEGPGVETTVLQLGADDYVLKPFDPGVLSSRVKAAFRRLRVAA
jgi:DNA-binding response OmpR family regulator